MKYDMPAMSNEISIERLELIANNKIVATITDDWSMAKELLELRKALTTLSAPVLQVPDEWLWDDARRFCRDRDISFPVEAAHEAVKSFRTSMLRNTDNADAYLNVVRADAIEEAAKQLYGQGYNFEILTQYAKQLRTSNDKVQE